MAEVEKNSVICGKCSGYKYGAEVEVRCADGTVRGVEVRTCYGPQFVRFAGVPYAKPPVGPLRFLPPVPNGPWSHTINATSLRDCCWSYDDTIEPIIFGTEDCLHATIHTPNVRPSKVMPVLVWIGSYDWCCDNHNFIGAGWLTDEEVIVVYISFRIGPFGFLSIREATAPGNCGLKDVVMALHWIQRNISAFGGDPENVTLFGSGTGSSMVHYMLLSPMATGLFHKAIIHSGSALHHWALCDQPIKSAKALAKELNIDTHDMIQAIDKLRSFSAEEIMNAFSKIMKRRRKKDAFYTFDTMFRPCIEVEFEGQPSFLTRTPHYMLRNGKFNRVPLIMGSNRQEGKVLKFYERSLTDTFERLNVNLSSLVPRPLRIEDSSSSSEMLGLRLMQFYVRGEKLTEENSNDFFNFMTDYYFTYYVNKSVKLHAKQGKEHPIFYYILDASSDWPMPKEIDMVKGDICLYGEMIFLFQINACAEYGGGGESNRIRQKMLKLWTNFAKHGNPTPDEDDDLLQVTWDAVTDPKRINYLSIAADLTKGCNPFFERMSFWDTVLDDTTILRMSTYFERCTIDDAIYD